MQESDPVSGAGQVDGSEPAPQPRLGQAESEALAGRVMAAAADLAQREAIFLNLVAEFDAGDARRWWDGFSSMAQWLSWSCSIAPGTAREQIRVARSLREMPLISQAFERGELSYSKVRELTRLTGEHDEEALLRLARAATASQLARTVSACRVVAGTQLSRELCTRVSWKNRDDGCVQISAVLTPEDGAAVLAALENAADEFRDANEVGCPSADGRGAGADGGAGVGASAGVEGRPSASDKAGVDGSPGDEGSVEVGDGSDANGGLVDKRPSVQVTADLAEPRSEVERRSRVSARVALANHWLGTRPEDRSGADRSTVVIEIGAAELADTLRQQAAEILPGVELSGSELPANPDVATLAGSPASLPTGQFYGPAAAPMVATPVGPADGDPLRQWQVPLLGPPSEGGPDVPTEKNSGVPAGTGSGVPAGTCGVRGQGGLEVETVRRLACQAQVHAVVRDLDGEPLAVSRSKRFGTRAQRRALMVRDDHCQFPGCARDRRLKIHHVRSWLDGGVTDLSNLILLCQYHHTAVHEGGITIVAAAAPVRWRFLRPDGSTIVPEVTGLRIVQVLPLLCDAFGRMLEDGPARRAALERRRQLIEWDEARRAELVAQQESIAESYRDIESSDDAAARRLFPVGGGEGFNLGNCVAVLFGAQRSGADDAHIAAHTAKAA